MRYIVVLLFVSSVATGQISEADGYLWTGSDLMPLEKAVFIAGVLNGVHAARPNWLDSLISRKATVDQFVKAIDDFYSDYRNLNLKIMEAFVVCGLKLSGASDDQVDWYSRFYRADALGRQEMNKHPMR